MGIVRVPSQRTLEKRYGDVKDLIARRATETGADMSTGLAQIGEVKRISEHISQYDGTEMGLIATNIRNMVNLYKLPVNGNEMEAHVIWMFADLKEFTKNRYRYNAYLKAPGRHDLLYRETYKDRITIERLNNRVLERIYKNPEVVPKVEEFLLRAYAKALEFHDWNFVPSGVVLTGTKNIMYAPLYHSQIFGHDALGIGIGRSFLYDIILDVPPENYSWLETTFVGLFAHELAHLHSADYAEVKEFAVMLLFDPKMNKNLEALHSDVVDWIDRQKRLPDHDALRHASTYDVQKYMGLIIAANEFARYNDEIRRLFKKDRSGNKLNATRDFMKLIRDSDVEEAKACGFVDRLLDGDIREMIRYIELID